MSPPFLNHSLVNPPYRLRLGVGVVVLAALHVSDTVHMFYILNNLNDEKSLLPLYLR